MTTVKDNIKALMRQKKLTIINLSQMSGIARSTLTKLLNGTIKSIKTEQLAAIASVLGVAPTELMDCDNTADTLNVPTSAHGTQSYGFVKVAAATVPLKPADCMGNAANIAERAAALAHNGVKLIVFGELSITGYTCGDLFFQNTLLCGALNGLRYIAQLTKSYDSIIAVGLPYSNDGRLYNVAAILHKGKVLGFVPKSYLPNYNEFYEMRQFTPAFEGIKTVLFDGYEVPFGTDIIFSSQGTLPFSFACEICEDLWVVAPPSQRHVQNGAQIIINLSASNETIGKESFRTNLVKMHSARLTAAYVYASTGEGESTSDIVFSGHNIVAENGRVLAQTPLFSCQSAISDIDVQYIDFQRRKLFHSYSEKTDNKYTRVNFIMDDQRAPLTRKYEKLPFVPQADRDARLKLILDIQANALKARIRHTKCDKLVLGVSGGLDSSWALIVCCTALQLLNRPLSDVISVTMPCFGTTQRTLNNSIALAQALGTTVHKIDITKAVNQHFEDIGHNADIHDVTYENSQARERTQVLMDIANSVNGLVIGTGDLSELALGWATYNGDHMSMYGVNASVPKTLIRHLIRYATTVFPKHVADILNDIADTPVSPELLPDNNGEIVQKTEDIVGPYQLHDFYLYHTLHNGFAPDKILYIAQQTFDEYDFATIKKWLNVFVKRFFAQQFKRNCMPDGIKIGSVSLSPRGDWRMPSDGSAATWLAALDNEVK